MISAFWSEWGDLNARPLEPHSSTLPSALHPDISNCSNNIAQAQEKCKPFFRLQGFVHFNTLQEFPYEIK